MTVAALIDVSDGFSSQGEWLVSPELIESKASAASKDQKRLFEFSVRVTVKRPQDQAPAVANAASAPASGAAAVKKKAA